MECIVVRFMERTALYLGQPVSIDMERCASLDAVDDARDAPHRPNVYVTDVPRVIMWRPSDEMHRRPIHGKDCALPRTTRVNRHGTLIEHGVSPDAADDTGDAPHRQNAYVTGVPRDDSVAPE